MQDILISLYLTRVRVDTMNQSCSISRKLTPQAPNDEICLQRVHDSLQMRFLMLLDPLSSL